MSSLELSFKALVERLDSIVELLTEINEKLEKLTDGQIFMASILAGAVGGIIESGMRYLAKEALEKIRKRGESNEIQSN